MSAAKHTPCPTCRQPIRPSAAFVRRLGMGAASWASFKHSLARLGVIAGPTADVPHEWQEAFARASGRTIAKSTGGQS